MAVTEVQACENHPSPSQAHAQCQFSDPLATLSWRLSTQSAMSENCSKYMVRLCRSLKAGEPESYLRYPTAQARSMFMGLNSAARFSASMRHTIAILYQGRCTRLATFPHARRRSSIGLLA